MDIPLEYLYTGEYKVSHFVQDGKLSNLVQLVNMVGEQNFTDIIIPEYDTGDDLVWEGANEGVMTVKNAYDHYREREQTTPWIIALWHPFLPPKISIFLWKIYHNRVATDFNLNAHGVIVDGG